jgi:hypothetical protein
MSAKVFGLWLWISHYSVGLVTCFAHCGGFSDSMPGKRSYFRALGELSIAQERRLARDEFYRTAHSGPNRSFVEVPRVLAPSIKAMSRSREAHLRHDTLNGFHSHYARNATLAAAPALGAAATQAALALHSAGNGAKHSAVRQVLSWADEQEIEFPPLSGGSATVLRDVGSHERPRDVEQTRVTTSSVDSDWRLAQAGVVAAIETPADPVGNPISVEIGELKAELAAWEWWWAGWSSCRAEQIEEKTAERHALAARHEVASERLRDAEVPVGNNRTVVTRVAGATHAGGEDENTAERHALAARHEVASEKLRDAELLAGNNRTVVTRVAGATHAGEEGDVTGTGFARRDLPQCLPQCEQEGVRLVQEGSVGLAGEDATGGLLALREQLCCVNQCVRQGLAAAKRLASIDEVVREFELEHMSKKFAVREPSRGRACELPEGDAAVGAGQTAERGSTGDVRLGGGIGSLVATSERFDVLVEDFGEPLGSARASPLGAPAAAAAAAAVATGRPSELPRRTRFETVAAAVLAIARQRKSDADCSPSGGISASRGDDAVVEKLIARGHTRGSGEERAEGPTAAKTLAQSAVGRGREFPEGDAAVVLEGGTIDAAQLQDVEAANRSEWKMPQPMLSFGGGSRSAVTSACKFGAKRELALSSLRDMLQQRPLPALSSFFAGICECEDEMWGLEHNDGLLLYGNDLETIAGTTEFEEFEEEACRALGIDMMEFTELSIQLCSAKGLVKLLLRRRIDSANDVDGDWEGGIIDAAQLQDVEAAKRLEWKRLEWIGAKQEFGLCCSLQEWLMMDGIEAVDVAED